MKRAIFFVPLICAVIVIGLFASPLWQGKSTNHMVSPLVGKQMPKSILKDFTTGRDIVLTATQEHLLIVNFFASWCVPCRAEQSVLMEIAKQGNIRIIGAVYKDTGANVETFLKETGNPFDAVGMDTGGKAAIDFGISGVPETFFVRGDGVVAYHHAGPLLTQDIEKILNEIGVVQR